jgi:hypothetical protein
MQVAIVEGVRINRRINSHIQPSQSAQTSKKCTGLAGIPDSERWIKT